MYRGCFLIALVALIPLTLTPHVIQGRSLDVRAATTEQQFIVGPRATLMPQGVFMLVRKDGKVGAIRFTSIKAGGPEVKGSAKYESLFQPDARRSLGDPSSIRKSGTIDLKPLSGIGHLVFQLGQDRVDVGPWAFGCSYAGRLDMWPYRGESKDYGYEFAPTSAVNANELNALDKHLRWFRFDSEASVTLAVSGLPK